jgi:methanogenic corrinoid protein MtbC1
MITEERTKEILKRFHDAVVNMDENAARELSQMALEEGMDAYEAVNKGLTPAMDRVSELYNNNEYYVPELLLCSDAMYAGLEVLRPHMKAEAQGEKRHILIGTVEGDIHDIGKNLVITMFEASGWSVHDLGRDVRLSEFVREQKRIRPDIVALSALMTTSMMAMPRAIEMIKAEDPEAAVIVGGAPLTRNIAMGYGADGYADNAGKAVLEAVQLLDRLGK